MLLDLREALSGVKNSEKSVCRRVALGQNLPQTEKFSARQLLSCRYEGQTMTTLPAKNKPTSPTGVLTQCRVE